MRYPPSRKRETRQRILEAAGKRFREKGFVSAGVDEVMGAAGLTAGAFYAHFPSKRALLREVLARSLEKTRGGLFEAVKGLKGAAWIEEVARRYLSRAHRDGVGEGCALPSLGAEVARQPEAVREVFDEYFLGLADAIEKNVPADGGVGARERAFGLLAMFVGGLSLARAVNDRALSDEILMACRKLALAGVEPKPENNDD